MIAATVTFGFQRLCMADLIGPPFAAASGADTAGRRRFLCKLPSGDQALEGEKMLIGVPLETSAGETRVAVTPRPRRS
jgi:hypothetical protein